MSATILRADARSLPLADDSVDLIVTSPPYFGLRSYQDGGKHYAGQIGSEPTHTEFVDELLNVTHECMRVLKPSGSLWVNLGDTYSSGSRGASNLGAFGQRTGMGGGWKSDTAKVPRSRSPGFQPKTLLGTPWRYALRCIDDLGLILRAEVVWDKPNGMPESVTDRVRRSHEQWFHFVLQPRYFSAVDEIREPHSGGSHTARTDKGVSPRNMRMAATGDHGVRKSNTDPALFDPRGKLPGSVWTIASEPLAVPDHLGVDHFAAFPTEWPRRIIQGWSPTGICVDCGEGRRPCVLREKDTYYGAGHHRSGAQQAKDGAAEVGWKQDEKWRTTTTIAGYICACAPYTDHPPGGNEQLGGWRRREYHLEQWAPAPTTPAVVLDPFGGTGTTALVATVIGRVGISVDASADYCRLAQWRVADPGELAKAARAAKPPSQVNGQASLLDLLDPTP